VCGLRWMDLNLDAMEVSINGAVNRSGVRSTTKTGNTRVVSLSPGTVTMLSKHQAHLGHPPADHYLFGGERPVKPNVMSADIRKAREALSLPPLTLRSIRHYVATQLMASGVDTVTVAHRL
jgi:integrase